ncbi:head-tail connector protein [Pseudomonas sp. W2-17]|uniref:head-tail connector protein n=1 Tax=Pseudomonas sp. W2-17 TaxID=3058039 RepID=UPI0034E0CF6A
MTIAVADLLSLNVIRLHLRIDHTDEDELILLYAESALAWALWYCDNPLLVAASDIPASFKVALLLLTAHSYENREAVASGAALETLPLAVDSFLWSSRNFRDAPEPDEENGIPGPWCWRP